MATYRLKSKLYGEFDKEEKKGILGTGITGGQALLAAGALVGGYKLAGAGKLGRGMQNSVNSFRMKTSAATSQRYRDAKASLLKNQRSEISQFNNYASSVGMKKKDITAGLGQINSKYGGLMYGGAAQYGPQA